MFVQFTHLCGKFGTDPSNLVCLIKYIKKRFSGTDDE